MTFYVHCLTSSLFRQEFYNMLSCFLWRNNRRVTAVTKMIGETTQTQFALTHLTKKRENGQECSIKNIE
jgi:hypothetical protein